ncbi:MAG: UTP--glucose-1-phosphate uridylyltransferase GalU [Thermoanaerobaculaceae bacterium]|nr:UTP--glucose-1-phosphate uridylyltransferase GalU [Thermoanaerobaculaceae bacterium]
MKIKRAVIPAAGLGTRFLPATKSSPKEMLPIVDKPAIQYVTEEAVQAGISSILIITGRGKEAIENYFDVSFELEKILEERGREEELAVVRKIAEMADVFYVRQREALGLGHAVYCAKNWTAGEPFAVFLGDDIIFSETPCIKQMMDIYDEKKCSILGVMDVAEKDTSKFGIIGGKEISDSLIEVTNIVEKPSPQDAPSNTAVVGRYILTPQIFEEIENTKEGIGGEIQLTDAIKSLLKKEKVYAYRFQGKRYDIGDKLGFLQATVEIALKREDLGEIFKQYLKELLKKY